MSLITLVQLPLILNQIRPAAAAAAAAAALPQLNLYVVCVAAGTDLQWTLLSVK